MGNNNLYEFKSRRFLIYYVVSISFFVLMAFAFENILVFFSGLIFTLLLAATSDNGHLILTDQTIKLNRIGILNLREHEFCFDLKEILKIEGILGGNTSGVQLYFKVQRDPIFFRISGFRISDFEKMKVVCESLKIEFSYGWRKFS